MTAIFTDDQTARRAHLRGVIVTQIRPVGEPTEPDQVVRLVDDKRTEPELIEFAEMVAMHALADDTVDLVTIRLVSHHTGATLGDFVVTFAHEAPWEPRAIAVRL